MRKSDVNILIVDDDNSVRTMLVEAIGKFGYRTSAAPKADEALNLVKIKPFHLALIDCMLPKTNGVDLAVQMRKSRFGNAPIILMSGVFRDKSFSAEAIEKSKAVDFIKKPFSISELKDAIDRALADLLGGEQVPLQVLISKPFSSGRERTRVIETLDEIKGYDLPFVICVLMDAKANGHLNIANDSGEIFGITLRGGMITKVDSSQSEVNLTMMLLDKGLIAKDDIGSIGGKRGDLVQSLVDQQYLSPHVLPQLHRAQIIEDLRRLFVDEKITINFVPDRGKDRSVEISLDDLTQLLEEVISEVIPAEHLRAFYKDWMEFGISPGPSLSADHTVFHSALLQKTKGISALLKNGLTIEEMRDQGGFILDDLLRALHLLVFQRIIVFDDVRKKKSFSLNMDRVKAINKEIQNKSPLEIFRYFGASEEVKEIEVKEIFKEFSRSNHPDHLPSNSTDEMRGIVTELFSRVSEANDILTDPQRRERLLKSLKQQEAERQIRAEAFTEEATSLLRKGRATEALEKTREAMKLHQSRNVVLAHAWALLKSQGDTGEMTSEAARLLDAIPHEERRNAHYSFVYGLLKKNLGDTAGAIAQLERSIAMDPNFLDARRERGSLGNAPEKLDIFNADLTALVGNFFKKKR